MACKIEEPGQAAIEKVLDDCKMKQADWHAVAKFVAAQQMRTPLFFVELVRRINEEIPQTLLAVLREFEKKSANQIAAEIQEPEDDHNYLREKLRVTVDPVLDGSGLALVQAQVSCARTAWLRFMRRMLTDRIDVFRCPNHVRLSRCCTVRRLRQMAKSIMHARRQRCQVLLSVARRVGGRCTPSIERQCDPVDALDREADFLEHQREAACRAAGASAARTTAGIVLLEVMTSFSRRTRLVAHRHPRFECRHTVAP